MVLGTVISSRWLQTRKAYCHVPVSAWVHLPVPPAPTAWSSGSGRRCPPSSPAGWTPSDSCWAAPSVQLLKPATRHMEGHVQSAQATFLTHPILWLLTQAMSSHSLFHQKTDYIWHAKAVAMSGNERPKYRPPATWTHGRTCSVSIGSKVSAISLISRQLTFACFSPISPPSSEERARNKPRRDFPGHNSWK